jgi:hypothetical protein
MEKMLTIAIEQDYATRAIAAVAEVLAIPPQEIQHVDHNDGCEIFQIPGKFFAPWVPDHQAKHTVYTIVNTVKAVLPRRVEDSVGIAERRGMHAMQTGRDHDHYVGNCPPDQRPSGT